MRLKISSLDLIAAFLAVAREGSLSAAARQLNTSQPTVRRHVETLESEVETQLFSRHPNGLHLTSTGQAVLAIAEEIEANAGAFVRTAVSDVHELGGVVRVTSSNVFAVQRLPQIIKPLLSQYPDLRIESVASNTLQNLLQRQSDIAVRLTEPKQQALVRKKVKPLGIGLFAAHSFVEQHGTPNSLKDLVQSFPFVSEDQGNDIALWFQSKLNYIPERIVFRTDDELAQIAAIEKGIGIGICQIKVAETLGLTRILPDYQMDLPVWIVMHEDLSQVQRVRLVFEHLVNSLS